ncbi:MAG: UDP-3-O-(3-hydroxymyristoyl)glucosamine N-acyltransferase [candidate division Zixibacteria bacterium]|nr:UDP-3-O-(3-hydroxymyristoyl)glucosamine N-acyltransferase [candidate division Zixibacteria bacterium]
MKLKLSEIAEKIGAELVGKDLTIRGLSTIDDPRPETLAFLSSRKYRKKLADCSCPAVIVPPKIESDKHSLLVMADPHLGFGLAMRLFHSDHHRPQPNIEDSAIVAKSAKIGKDVYIGHHAVISNSAIIGDYCVIHPGVYIGESSIIGENCYIYPNAVIMHEVTVGRRVAIYSGAVIGSDGFGYAKNKNEFVKIPQTGTVVIEDDVEIGAGTTIDRATLGETRIGTGAILDNLIQIGHNCKIGAGSIICAQVGLAGTTTIGKNVILAGQVGVAGHLTIGDGSLVEAQSGVPSDLPPKSVVFGYPAKPAMHAHRIDAIVNRLPDYIQRLRAIERKVGKSESN